MAYGYLDQTTDRLTGGSRAGGGVAVTLSGRVDSDLLALGLQSRATDKALSMYQAAETALDALAGRLAGMGELAREASSGHFTQGQVRAMDAEYQALAAEAHGILANTRFGDTILLSGTDSLVNFNLNAVTSITLANLTDSGMAAIATAIANITAAKADVSAGVTQLETSLTAVAQQADRLTGFAYSIASVEQASRTATRTAAGIRMLYTLACSVHTNLLADQAIRLLDLDLSTV